MKVRSYVLLMTSISSCSAFADENAEQDKEQLLLAAAQTANSSRPNERNEKHRTFYSFMSRPYRDRPPSPPIRSIPFWRTAP